MSTARANRSLLSEGMLLAALPAFGYWFSYLYERGFCGFLSIPAYLISIDVTAILSMAFVIAALIVFLPFLGDSFGGFLSRLPQQVKRSLFPLLAGVFWAVCFVLGSNASNTFMIIMLMCVVSAYFAGAFLPPFFAKRANSSTYLEELEKIQEEDSKTFSTVAIAYSFMSRNAQTMFITFTFFSILCFGLGGLKARTQIEFVVVQESPTLIVLRAYSDKAIVAELNKEEKTVSKYKIKSIYTDISDFSTQRVGPISKKKEKSPNDDNA